MSIISYTCWLLMLHPAVYLQASNQVESSFRFGPDSKYKYETIPERNYKRKHHLRFYPNYSSYTVVPSTVVLPIHISAEVKRNAPDDTLKLSKNRESSLRTTIVAYKRKIKKGKINISDGIKWEYLDDQVTPQLIKSPRKRKLFLQDYDHQALEYSQVEQDTKLREGSRTDIIMLPYSTYKGKRKWNKVTTRQPRPTRSTKKKKKEEIFDEEKEEEICDDGNDSEENKSRQCTSSTTVKHKKDTEEILDTNGVPYEPTTTEEKKKRKRKKKYRHHKHTHNHHYQEKKEHKTWWQNFVSYFWSGKK